MVEAGWKVGADTVRHQLQLLRTGVHWTLGILGGRKITSIVRESERISKTLPTGFGWH